MALLAAAFHPPVKLLDMPQRRGTNSHAEEGRVPVELPQLYTQEIDLELAKPDRSETSLKARPRLLEELLLLEEVVTGAAAETAFAADETTGTRVVGMTTAA